MCVDGSESVLPLGLYAHADERFGGKSSRRGKLFQHYVVQERERERERENM